MHIIVENKSKFRQYIVFIRQTYVHHLCYFLDNSEKNSSTIGSCQILSEKLSILSDPMEICWNLWYQILTESCSMFRDIEMIWNPIEILKFQQFLTADNFRRIPIGSDRLRLAWEVNEIIEVTANDLHLVCQTLSFVKQEQSELKSWCFLYSVVYNRNVL